MNSDLDHLTPNSRRLMAERAAAHFLKPSYFAQRLAADALSRELNFVGPRRPLPEPTAEDLVVQAARDMNDEGGSETEFREALRRILARPPDNPA